MTQPSANDIAQALSGMDAVQFDACIKSVDVLRMQRYSAELTTDSDTGPEVKHELGVDGRIPSADGVSGHREELCSVRHTTKTEGARQEKRRAKLALSVAATARAKAGAARRRKPKRVRK